MYVALKTCKLGTQASRNIWPMPKELEMFWKSSPWHWHGTQSRKWPRTRRARPRFCILKVLGDLLDDGELHFVERAQTFEAARRRIEALAAGRPSQYVIYNGETGERVSIVAGGKRGQSGWRFSDVDLT